MLLHRKRYANPCIQPMPKTRRRFDKSSSNVFVAALKLAPVLPSVKTARLSNARLLLMPACQGEAANSASQSVFCAMRQSTPLGSDKMKSRMRQGCCAMLPQRTP